ncbi:hypothetical protein DFQ30_008266 [Apophysomyces sp. BC1015]|nr:hypothetical protein DFQ30_008266 [Apophysomyces sp. BC1015]
MSKVLLLVNGTVTLLPDGIIALSYLVQYGHTLITSYPVELTYRGNHAGTYVLEELSVLDLKTYTWTRYKDMPARYNHSATLVGQKMYIYGGKDEQGHTVSDLYMVHLKAPPYAPHLLLGGTQTHSGSKMVLMKSQHFCDTMCGKLLIFGRYISKSQPSKHTNDQTEASYSLWLLDLDTLEWSRQECGGYFEIGGWNYFTVISESSTKDALLINGESLGLYDVATRPFPNDFVCLLNNPELSDFVIIPADGQKIYVHQVILIARWPHFQNMYRSGMAESLERQMEVPESYSVVMAFVRYLYTDSLDEHETWPVVCEVLVLANMYLLTRLKKLCCERLYRRHLSVGSCGLIFETAIVAEETGLKLLVLDFIFQNYGAILKSNMLMQVPLSVRQEFLEAVPDEAVLEVGRMRYRSIKSGPTGGLVSVTHPQSHSQQHPPTSSYSSANNSLTQNYDHSTSALAATVSM